MLERKPRLGPVITELRLVEPYHRGALPRGAIFDRAVFSAMIDSGETWWRNGIF